MTLSEFRTIHVLLHLNGYDSVLPSASVHDSDTDSISVRASL